MRLKTLFSILFFFFFSYAGHSQTALGDYFEIYWDGLSDHPFLLNSKKRSDTSKWIIKNKYKNSIWGNSTYIAAAATFSRSSEYEVSIGRTKAISTNYGRGMGYTNMGSYGFTLFFKDNLKGNNLGGKFFLEYNHRPFWILGSFVLRTDYSYNFTTRHQYITPSAGISIIFLDILYNYSFPLSHKQDRNYYKNGITLRLKRIIGRQNWETNKPNR